MIFATEHVQRYKQALSYLWNVQFWGVEQFRGSVTEASFDRLKLPLFLQMVLSRLGSDLPAPEKIFGEPFKLVPRLQYDVGISNLSVKLPDTTFATRRGPFKAGDITLSAIDFFDWQRLDFRDFRYFLARIEDFPVEPNLVSCEALVEVSEVDVIWHPPGILGLPAAWPDDIRKQLADVPPDTPPTPA